MPDGNQQPTLPPRAKAFIGRQSELGAIDSIFARSSGRSCVILHGMSGVGKSAIAMEWAYRNSERFPDGCLWVDVGGRDPHDALNHVLHSFSVHFRQLEPEAVTGLAARISFYKTMTAGKRFLLVLDDAQSAEPFSSLLPSTPRELVLITSRSSLEELIRLGASQVHVPPLNSLGAKALLADLVGEARLEADPHMTQDLIEICAGLPAVIRICAARLAAHPSMSLSQFVQQLPVDPLQIAEPETALAVEFDLRLSSVKDELITRLCENPELMYQLRPRELEELVADLYSRQGFDVELTQATHDGGVDMYVASYGPFGRATTLVDVKRNRPDRPVGVDVLRQLYGVVESKRATAGVLVTTSFFSPQAQTFQRSVECRLGLRNYYDLQAMLGEARLSLDK
jgi:Restriction endonuclease/NB-ARC domain